MKSSAPPPDPNVGLAQRQMADIAHSAEQRAVANDQYFRENFAPRYLQQMDDQISMSKQAQDYSMGLAQKYDQRFWDTTAKQQDKFYADVDAYDTSQNRERLANQGMADVEQQAAIGNMSLQRGLARRGVNPGSAAYATMMADNQRQTSLARASAATMATEAARREGLGGNLTGASAGFLGTGLQAGQAGLNAVGTAQQGFNANNQQFNNALNTAGGLYGNIGNLGMQQWQTRAQMNSQNANSFNSMLGTGAGIAAGIMFSDRRLKTDIKEVGVLNIGLNVYKYRYKDGGPIHIGVMAQDVKKVKPDAVVEKVDGKHDAVDYSKL